MRLLHLIPALDHDSPARDLLHLVGHLPQDELECTVACLGGDVVPLAGVACLSLGGSRRFDPRPLLELRRLCRRWQPDLVHVWQPAALRALRLAGISAPVVCSAAVAPTPATFDRWLLRGVERVVVRTNGEAERCRRLGLAAEQLVRLPTACAPRPTLPRRQPRTIACLGRLERSAGFMDAPWAFDILRFLQPDLELLIIGDGPDRPRLAGFAASTQSARQVHFVGARADGPDLLAQAEVVWALDRYESGLATGLLALAAGRPLVMTAPSALAECITPGETALAYRAGEPAELARQTRQLLDEGAPAAGLAAAARAAAEQFPVAELVRRAMLLYQELRAASRSRQAVRVGA